MPSSANGSIACGSLIENGVQPRMCGRQGAKPVRTDDHADEDEADDRVIWSRAKAGMTIPPRRG